MLTKDEIAEKLIAKGVALPANWGKLSQPRAQALLDAKPSVMKTLGKAIGAAVEAIRGLPEEPEHFGQTKSATMPKDPKWKRRPEGAARGWYPVTRRADNPVPMTRQVERSLERRKDKMPIGAKQSVWHKAQGFAKIGGRRSA